MSLFCISCVRFSHSGGLNQIEVQSLTRRHTKPCTSPTPMAAFSSKVERRRSPSPSPHPSHTFRAVSVAAGHNIRFPHPLTWCRTYILPHGDVCFGRFSREGRCCTVSVPMADPAPSRACCDLIKLSIHIAAASLAFTYRLPHQLGSVGTTRAHVHVLNHLLPFLAWDVTLLFQAHLQASSFDCTILARACAQRSFRAFMQRSKMIEQHFASPRSGRPGQAWVRLLWRRDIGLHTHASPGP